MDVRDNRVWSVVLCLSQTTEDDGMIRPIGSQGNRLRLTSHDFHQPRTAYSSLRAPIIAVRTTNDSGL